MKKQNIKLIYSFWYIYITSFLYEQSIFAQSFSNSDSSKKLEKFLEKRLRYDPAL